jgi:hypothetical protein
MLVGLNLIGGTEVIRQTGQRLTLDLDARLFVFTIAPGAFSLLGLISAIGIFYLKEWARIAVLCLSTVPVLGSGLLVTLQPQSVFPPPQPDEQYAIATIGNGLGLAIYEVLLVVLIPVSIWWLVLFTRASVKTQFRTK